MEKALRSGHALHTFRSGGGLQVARIEKVKHGERRGSLKGYGEHPHINEALRHAGEDFAAGGRPYSEVYGTFDVDDPHGGKTGIYPMYLTGTHDVDGELDKWSKNGTLAARATTAGEIEVELKGWGEHRTPKEIYDQLVRDGGSITWSNLRRCTFRSTATSTEPIARPDDMPHHRVWSWRTSQVGRAKTFLDAVTAAFQARVTELDD